MNAARKSVLLLSTFTAFISVALSGHAQTEIRSSVAAAGEAKDVEYGVAGDESLGLDVGWPAGEGPFPIAILIHGGGWGSGDKSEDFVELFKPLTGAGFVWFSINYRLAPQHRWPACFDDVLSAITWVRKHAAEYHADPKRIALVGYSAGGQLATLAAIRLNDTLPVQAVVGLAPAVDLVNDLKRRGEVSLSLRNLLDLPETLDRNALARIATISPAEEVVKGLPPFLLVQGDSDQSVRHTETRQFAENLRKAKVPCEFVTLNGVPHRIADWKGISPDYPKRIVTWLQSTLGNQSP